MRFIAMFLFTIIAIGKEVITHEWEIENSTYYAATKNESYIRFKSLSKNNLVLDKDITGYIKKFKVQASREKEKPNEWFNIKIEFESTELDVNSKDFNVLLAKEYFSNKKQILQIKETIKPGTNSISMMLLGKEISMKADLNQSDKSLKVIGKGKTALSLLGLQQLPSPYGPIRELIEVDFNLKLDLQ